MNDLSKTENSVKAQNKKSSKGFFSGFLFGAQGVNKALAPKIDKCITEMYKKSGAKLKNKYAGLFTITFETWEQFYKKVLYAYTIAGFLYYKMNEFLRNEDWEKLGDLLPYTYSLFKAFLWESTAAKSSKTFEFLRSITKENKLILYRGADFDDDSLRFYHPNQIKYFSWNGVTSTSLDVSAARGFQNCSKTKTPVLITVEIDFENLNPQDLNALHLEGVSQHPKEKEVALPPGSIFELLSRLEKKSEVEIRLKLVTDPKVLAHQGQFMHGMLQAVMGEEDELKVVCLKEKELSRAIKHCKGNQLISGLEFSLCSFNEKSARLFQEVLPTMKNLTSLTLNSLEFEGESCFDKIIKYLGILKLTKLTITNSISNAREFRTFIDQIQYFGFLRSLKLSFPENYALQRNFDKYFWKMQLGLREDYWMNDHLVRELNNQVSQYLNPKCVFEFNMANVSGIIFKGLNINKFLNHIGEKLRKKLWMEGHDDSQEEDVLNLVPTKTQLVFGFVGKNGEIDLKPTLKEALKHKLKPLKTLSLIFDGCQNLNLKNFGCEEVQHFQHFQSLTTLNLNFNGCYEIAEFFFKNLSKDVILPLPLLCSLNICFDNCINVTDGGLKNLICDGIQYLEFLVTLKLSFNRCQAITNQGLKYFSNLGKIKSLNLSFGDCTRITDSGFEDFLGLQTLQFLTNLDLNFSRCSAITDNALKILSHKTLQNLKKNFTSLSLKFDDCDQITDQGLGILVSEGVNHLESLQTLHLNFKDSGTGRNSLLGQGLFYFVNYINNSSSLKDVHLNLSRCGSITSNILRSFCFPKTLITLHLSFNNCRRIDPEICQGLPLSHLTSLESLYLSFQKSQIIIDDQSFELLCSQEIKHLKNLKILRLDFGKDLYTAGITDKGLSNLASDGIRHLPKLTTLYLDFNGHPDITHQGMRNLCANLKNVTDLHLGFERITDKGLKAFRFQALSLETLSLRFSSASMLSNKSFKKFWKEGIRPLNKLKNLNLQFESCWEITAEGFKFMCHQGIHYLTSLVSLNLNFSYCKNFSQNQVFSLQSQIDLLNLPQIQLSVAFLKSESQLTISSSRSHPAGSVICQDKLEPLANKEQNKVESLTLTFEKENFSPDLDIPRIICTLKTLKNLKDLHLTFGRCAQITDFRLHEFCSQGIQHLEFLNSLYLSFAGVSQFTEKGLRILVSRGIKYVKLLVSLSLNFDGCREITDEGIEYLCDQGIIPLKSLKILCLSFKGCDKITNKSVKSLYHKGMKSLTSFFIDFSEVEITERLKKQLSQSSSSSAIIIARNKLDSAINASHFQRHNIDKQNIQISEKDSDEIEITNTMFLRYMTRKHYELHTHDGEIETVENLLKSPQKDTIPFLLLFSNTKLPEKFISQELTYWNSLTSLYLFLDQWREYVTDSTLNTLSIKVFQHLKSLTTLYLNFNSCDKITDHGVRTLCCDGLKVVKELTTLSLNFSHCSRISEKSLEILCHNGIKHLGSLTNLHLCFSGCLKISSTQLSSLINQINLLHLPHLQGPLKIDNSDCIFSQFNPLLTPLSKVDQKLRNKTIMKTMIRKPKNISDLFVSQKDRTGNLKTPEAVSIIFDTFKHIAKQLTSILEKNQSQDADTSAKFRVDFDIQGKIIEDDFDIQSKIIEDGFDIQGKIIEDVFGSLFSRRAQSRVVLTKLHLGLYNGEETEGHLYQWIRNLKHLNVLSLKLSNSTYKEIKFFTDAGFQLEALHLNLNGCDNITDLELASFCIGWIQNLNKLKTLHLSFDGCDLLTVEALKSILKMILKLSSIENLGLSFLQCQKIPPSSYQAFLKILSYFGFARADQTSKYLEWKEIEWQPKLKISKIPKCLKIKDVNNEELNFEFPSYHSRKLNKTLIS